MKAIIKGIFTWDGAERRSDRYGMVTVCTVNYNDNATAAVSVEDVTALALLTNERARIKVKVIEARKSGHVGDMTRKIYPSTPEVGAEFDLGVGTLRVQEADWSSLGVTIGLEPDDGRATDWFDPRILYQLHDQTVEIVVERASAGDRSAPVERTVTSIDGVGFEVHFFPDGEDVTAYQMKIKRGIEDEPHPSFRQRI